MDGQCVKVSRGNRVGGEIQVRKKFWRTLEHWKKKKEKNRTRQR